MTGSTISPELRARIRLQAGNRCGYCLTRQEYLPWVLEIEHIVPRSKGGDNTEENLWLACHACNLFKSDQTHGHDPLTGRSVRLFNPRRQKWRRHFHWSEDGAFIIGRTACGRATVIALNLNNLIAVTVRRNWIAAGWHPPKD
ncbi:MAG: HNH endonuclease [Anaerolineaceae bacterium]|nr:HNH endonuclease [Anaerolineaceae bacterium]